MSDIVNAGRLRASAAHVALLLAALPVAACDRRAPLGAALAKLSGVDGAGAGPSTAAAPRLSPGPTNGTGADSTRNDNGPNAGGQH